MKYRTAGFMTLAAIALISLFWLTGSRADAASGFEAACLDDQQGPPPPPLGGPGRGPRPGGDGDRMLMALVDLTADQKDQIKKLHEAEREAARPYHEKLRAADEQLRAATKDGAFDEAAIRTILASSQQAEVELKVLGLRTRNAVYNVLTAEQKAKLAEMRGKMHPPRDGQRPQHDGPRPPRPPQ